MKYLLALGLNLVLTLNLGATPRVGVSFNQYLPTDNFSTPIDFAWLVQANSPSFDFRNIVTATHTRRVVIEQGAIDRNQLLTGWGDPSKAVIRQEIDLYKGTPNYMMVYYEGGGPTLIPTDIPLAYGFLHKPLILLYRDYHPDVLDKTLIQNVGGAVFEFIPDMRFVPSEHIGEWIDYVVSKGKQPYLLIPPAGVEEPYVHQVIQSLSFIKGECKNFNLVIIIFAVYNRSVSHVDFKRISSAIKVFRYNF